MRAFPPRLFWQPIFYPVLNFKYAAEIAERWNMKDEESGGAGFVTSFEIPIEYFQTFEIHTVGMSYHLELWVPAEDLGEFNRNIQHGIRIDKAFVAKEFLLSEKIAKALQP